MVMRMKNFNILGVHWKIQLLGRGSQKTSIEGGIASKGGGLGQFADRGDSVLEGELIPQFTLWVFPKSFDTS